MTQKKTQELPKAYDPKQVEERLYNFWLSHNLFTPPTDSDKKPFTIIMPPPNVTGELHLGHALVTTVEDIMVRWHRMLGEPTLWLPGTDHAGIATQVVVERELAKKGLNRHQMGREKFLERVWDWVNRYGRKISEQHRRLGASCDWTRERFTLDPGPSRAVRTTFVNLYKKGLIYRGERIINWCIRCSTALSDLEVEHRDTQGNLYYIHYPLVGGRGEIPIATTRPETLLGDTAVAVNPKDIRYQHLIGEYVELPILKRPIQIIADEAVDPEFGTGSLKITPGHDPIDFEVGQRHKLPIVTTFNLDGTMNQEAGPYVGMDRYECRKAIVQELERQGLLKRIEPYTHSVGHCQRCRETVEPLVSKQWFVKMDPLSKPAIKAVADGEIKIIPERFTKTYLSWLENIRDWCISRQLWWGHRIPVWYCKDCAHLTVEYQDPTSCSMCSSQDISQDPDVLDTWFSSALWPHSTLGWPDDTEEFRRFYPTSVMETGYDILFFWVARMIIMGLENTGQVPFHTVYLHGLIRDIEGQKMSKTKGNVIDPVEAIDTYGCDALRFAVTTGTTPGNDQRLGTTKLEAGRNFANKLWNASRFVISAIDNAKELDGSRELKQLSHPEDRWIVSRLNRVIEGVNQYMEGFQFGEAERVIYEFIWGEYCDWYIEMAKIRLRSGESPSPLPVLAHVLENTLRLLHPFMPFITEEIWQNLTQRLPKEGVVPESIAIASYPHFEGARVDLPAEEAMTAVSDIIRAIRNLRAEFRVDPRQPLEASVQVGELQHSLSVEAKAIQVLARVEPFTILRETGQRPSSEGVTLVLPRSVVSIHLEGIVDLKKEKERLSGELGESRAVIQRLEAHLEDGEFTDKAPADVVERERLRLESSREREQRLRELISQLSG